MEFQTIKNAVHYVFDTKEEYLQHFSSQGIPAPEIKSNWREADELDWVMSDDGRIIQILRKGSMKNTVRSPDKNHHAYYYMRTLVGSFPVSKNQKMDTDFANHKNRYMFGCKFIHWKKSVEDREKNHNNDNAFAYLIAVVRDKPEVAYMKVFRTNNYQYAKRMAWVLLKQERIKVAIRKELKDIAEDLGMDEKFHLEEVKKIILGADKDAIRLAALSLSGKWTGMEEKEELNLIPPPTEPKKLDSPEMQKRLQASTKSISEVKNIND